MIDLSQVGIGRRAERPYVKIIYDLVLSHNAQLVFEIGSGHFTFSQAILAALEKTGGHLTSCDPAPRTQFQHPQLTFLHMPSNTVAASWKEQIDILLIDGDHTEPQVNADYVNFRRHLKPGGLIIFHDINIPHGPGIQRLWNQLKTIHSVILESSPFPGLGVLQVS